MKLIIHINDESLTTEVSARLRIIQLMWYLRQEFPDHFQNKVFKLYKNKKTSEPLDNHTTLSVIMLGQESPEYNAKEECFVLHAKYKQKSFVDKIKSLLNK
jgi:hypothetical protein